MIKSKIRQVSDNDIFFVSCKQFWNLRKKNSKFLSDIISTNKKVEENIYVPFDILISKGIQKEKIQREIEKQKREESERLRKKLEQEENQRKIEIENQRKIKEVEEKRKADELLKIQQNAHVQQFEIQKQENQRIKNEKINAFKLAQEKRKEEFDNVLKENEKINALKSHYREIWTIQLAWHIITFTGLYILEYFLGLLLGREIIYYDFYLSLICNFFISLLLSYWNYGKPNNILNNVTFPAYLGFSVVGISYLYFFFYSKLSQDLNTIKDMPSHGFEYLAVIHFIFFNLEISI